MRHVIVIILAINATEALADPLDFLLGTSNLPGVVQGKSFGSSGNDYYGEINDRRRGPWLEGIHDMKRENQKKSLKNKAAQRH